MSLIKNEIHWVGFIDGNLRNFHGYATPAGSTYNAFIVLDEKPTLIDTVKSYGFDEMLARIRAVIDPANIRYIISNHTEMDHSGTIEQLLAYCPQAEVVCSPKGEEGLRRHFKKNWKFKVVNTGDTLSIGRRSLQFFLMPMVHWPDSMATYSPADRILFPNDAFGQHIASPERFADEYGIDRVCEQAAKYYANIVMPYGNQVVKVLEALQALPLEMILPSHGLFWRRPEDIRRIVDLYGRWARYEAENRAVIIYDSMWHSTEKMAQALFYAIEKENIPVSLLSLQTSGLSDVITEVMRSKCVLVGSSILNNNVLPTVGAFLTYVRGLKPRNRYGVTFGSYGWSTVGFKMLTDFLREAGIEPMDDGHYVRYIPDAAELAQLCAVAAEVKKRLTT
ncbi:MAG: FprA family A-type flavoprotein [Candidatus Omnitrophica bacterium]|nr:FprA family A-type flavoprotein [Candidatus Omnitrophota bacterium]